MCLDLLIPGKPWLYKYVLYLLAGVLLFVLFISPAPRRVTAFPLEQSDGAILIDVTLKSSPRRLIWRKLEAQTKINISIETPRNKVVGSVVRGSLCHSGGCRFNPCPSQCVLEQDT